MTIIKPGKLDSIYKPMIFECYLCGCVFKADNTEYQRQFSKATRKSWYEIKCPTCGIWVTKDESQADQGKEQ